ncbi:MAG: hypothetical protein M1820_008141 [Bogoriella megaspora]|nr:MAG: hypothetical protein M1820_008141 [Bogoriella megaspora]
MRMSLLPGCLVHSVQAAGSATEERLKDNSRVSMPGTAEKSLSCSKWIEYVEALKREIKEASARTQVDFEIEFVIAQISIARTARRSKRMHALFNEEASRE